MGTRIVGTGSYIPARIVTNDDLSKVLDTSDEWISTRTGIHSRHIAQQEKASDMAVKASKKAIQDSGILAKDIDVIIVATSSPDYAFPSTASLVQKEINAVNAVCFDVSVACTGFIYAYSIANAYITSGVYKNILIIGTEVMSSHIDWKDRSVCVLFGDGAGAVVVTKDSENISQVIIHNDGSKAEVLKCGSDNIYMNGQEVFKFAVKTVPMSIMEVLNSKSIKKSEIKFYILHQANKRIIEAVAKRLNEDIQKFPMNLSKYGNTSAASIPILIDELSQAKKIRKNDLIVISGFGAGLSWGSILLNW